jgi:hypothetical protein
MLQALQVGAVCEIDGFVLCLTVMFDCWACQYVKRSGLGEQEQLQALQVGALPPCNCLNAWSSGPAGDQCDGLTALTVLGCKL